MKAVAIIPARWGSRRFPGKVAAPIAGQSMIEHVWRAVRQCSRLRDVIVATDDRRVAALCEGFGATARMTSEGHATGTDRIAEVASTLEDALIVNVQGDEPLIEPRVIEAALDALLADAEAQMATVAHPLETGALEDPNRVKVGLDSHRRAVDFTRTVPPGASPTRAYWQHVGLYVYPRSYLMEFVQRPRSRTEIDRDLEQWRALDQGHSIAVGKVDGWHSVPVDVPADVARVEALLMRSSSVAEGS
ncbi:3-deoxy-manno-octulosonate cytidylyltransferase [Myxococcota bacterium]|nr:3-deoxy-manno-octulosonate cytidylyltransferase [Myxococcota bacterium]